MRIFIDEYRMDWDRAWDITTRTCAYTNHTILPEALEEWSVSIFEHLLPRHLEILYEINRRFLRDVSVRYPGDEARISRLSLIREKPSKKVRMANLAIVGSHSVNGVAKLHTRLLKEEVFKEFDELFPGRINNKTNGVTPRRWLLAANPGLAELITEKIGKGWIKNLDELRMLEPFAENAVFQKRFNDIKRRNKENLAVLTRGLTGVPIDPVSIYDVQIKRIHEYKRQLMNILHVVYLWLRLKEEPDFKMHPRTFIFAGKAAPSYAMAKMIIRLICHVGEMINDDPMTNDILKVVFLPNYSVSLAERIIPAADISEQISTAGYEASGTGNMKLALNGALTVGTLDGANIEIMEEVGEENIFIFGLHADEVLELRKSYDPRQYYEKDAILKKAIDLIADGLFSPDDRQLFRPLADYLLKRDPYLVLADFESYRKTHEKIDLAYQDRLSWAKTALLNVARMGRFSSDRAILEYNRDIWHAEPVKISSENFEKAQTDQAQQTVWKT
ncbi:MAG: hypothetical protein B6D63_04365 [Candidatus Latescibacteria bacterium 4484_7]|nr:MAG: hypothetical protein B6D63_04365 [Candidatus Latescibacteria bacterium 4484_7]